MSIVTQGYGDGLLVTQGYGAPAPDTGGLFKYPPKYTKVEQFETIIDILGTIAYDMAPNPLPIEGTLSKEQLLNFDLRGTITFTYNDVLSIEGKSKLSKALLYFLLEDS